MKPFFVFITSNQNFNETQLYCTPDKANGVIYFTALLLIASRLPKHGNLWRKREVFVDSSSLRFERSQRNTLLHV